MPIWLTGKVIAYSLLVLALMGAIGTGVYKIKQWGASEVQQKWDQAVRDQTTKELDQAMKAANNRETDNAKSKIVYRTIKEQVVTYIDRPVYSNVCIDPDGLRGVNDALLGTLTPTPKSDAGVPAVNTPSR